MFSQVYFILMTQLYGINKHVRLWDKYRFKKYIRKKEAQGGTLALRLFNNNLNDVFGAMMSAFVYIILIVGLIIL